MHSKRSYIYLDSGFGILVEDPANLRTQGFYPVAAG